MAAESGEAAKAWNRRKPHAKEYYPDIPHEGNDPET
ncbi:hypothetical protein M145_3669, partial [Bacteroides fragilis str. 34-F-2 